MRSGLFLLRTGLLLGLGTVIGARCPCTYPADAPRDFGAEDGVVPMPLDGTLVTEVQNYLCDTQEFRDMADSAVKGVRQKWGDDADSMEPKPEWGLVSAPFLNNGMVHDCQRLVSGGSLGPQVALLVSEYQVAQDDYMGGRVVADIVNYGPDEYEPLGIQRGISCLWIQGSGDASDDWDAAILQPDTTVPGTSGGCAAGAFTSDTTWLEVERLQIVRGSGNYPPTGRWMWNGADEEQYIGIRCGDGWCEIGKMRMDRSGMTESIATEDDVPGRWDEQYLSYAPDSTLPGDLELTRIWGRISPGEDNTYVEGANPAGSVYKDMHVATLWFIIPDRDPDALRALAAYGEKFGFDATTVGSPIRVHLRKTHTCDSQRQMTGAEYALEVGGSGVWMEVNRCNMTHSGSGTVRWAWDIADEGIWVPCDEGCCKTSGEEEE